MGNGVAAQFEQGQDSETQSVRLGVSAMTTGCLTPCRKLTTNRSSQGPVEFRCRSKQLGGC